MSLLEKEGTTAPVALTTEDVEKMRQELLLLLKNVPSRITRRNIPALRDAFIKMRDQHESWVNALLRWEKDREAKAKMTGGHHVPFYDASSAESLRVVWWQLSVEINSMLHQLHWKGEKAHDPEERIAQLSKQHPDTDWRDYFSRRPDPTQNELDERELERIRGECQKQKNRIMRKARALWKEMRHFIRYADDLTGLDFGITASEEATIEGLTFIFHGLDRSKSGSHYIKSDLDRVKALPRMVRYYRQRAERYAPMLLRHALPVHYFFKSGMSSCGGDAGACYTGRAVEFTPWGIGHETNESWARVMAHEMGHHIHNMLSRRSQEFWAAAIRGELGQLDVAEVAARMKPGETGIEFGKRMKKEDPLLYLQVEALWHHHGTKNMGIYDLDSLVRAYREGKISTVTVPKMMITPYGHKNPEEAFCEALAHIVAYGPRTMPEKVRWLLSVILPRSEGWRLKERSEEFLGLFGE